MDHMSIFTFAPKYYITKFPFVNTFPSDFRDIFYFALFYEIISLFFCFFLLINLENGSIIIHKAIKNIAFISDRGKI